MSKPSESTQCAGAEGTTDPINRRLKLRGAWLWSVHWAIGISFSFQTFAF